jgi:hypothetical protein
MKLGLMMTLILSGIMIKVGSPDKKSGRHSLMEKRPRELLMVQPVLVSLES